jgi:hypothetical protein
MFDLNNKIEVKATMGDVVEGIVLEQPTWVMPKQSQVGALAVRAESVYGFMNWIEATKNEVRNPSASPSSKRIGKSGGWQEFPSFEDCYETFRDRPWEVRKFTQNDVPLKFSDNVGNQVEYDVVGDYIDMGRFLDGEPECFGRNVMGNPQGLFAKIVMNLSTSAFVEGATLKKRGERVARLVDWLENQHIRTEVLAFNASECAHVEVVVKRFDEGLNLDTIAVAGNGDFYRRLVFRVMEMSKTWREGHGTACTIYQGRLKLPPIETNGILIFSENGGYPEDMDRKFDKLEKDLEQALEDGDRFYRSTV